MSREESSEKEGADAMQFTRHETRSGELKCPDLLHAEIQDMVLDTS